MKKKGKGGLIPLAPRGHPSVCPRVKLRTQRSDRHCQHRSCSRAQGYGTVVELTYLRLDWSHVRRQCGSRILECRFKWILDEQQVDHVEQRERQAKECSTDDDCSVLVPSCSPVCKIQQHC